MGLGPTLLHSDLICFTYYICNHPISKRAQLLRGWEGHALGATLFNPVQECSRSNHCSSLRFHGVCISGREIYLKINKQKHRIACPVEMRALRRNKQGGLQRDGAAARYREAQEGLFEEVATAWGRCSTQGENRCKRPESEPCPDSSGTSKGAERQAWRELKEDEGQAEHWRRQGPEHMHLPGRARDLEFQRGFQGALSPLSYFIFTMIP